MSENFDTQTETKKDISNPPRVFSLFNGDVLSALSHATIYDSLFSGSMFAEQGVTTLREVEGGKITLEKFWATLELSNVKVVVAPKVLSDRLKDSPYFTYLTTFDQLTLYVTNNTTDTYVVPLKNKVTSISDLNTWKKTSKQWYKEYTPNASFIVYDPDEKKNNTLPFMKYDPKNRASIPYDNDCQVQEFVRREKIDISTNCIGHPLLIKYAYHPNWQVKGANGIYLATPAFMVVTPTQEHVTVYFGKRAYNYVAYLSLLLGILLLIFHQKIEYALQKNALNFYANHRTLFQN